MLKSKVGLKSRRSAEREGGWRLLHTDENGRLSDFLSTRGPVLLIIDALREIGAQVYLVGGAVRDLLLQRVLKDLDIEVHGIELDVLRGVLEKYGHVEAVGKSFGVLKLFEAGGSDWSIPRKDGPGRKPIVSMAPYMAIEEALLRRDLTMNAMALDLHEKVLIDPFGGEADMQERCLRCVDPETFIEDPLRFFRVMQFVARFDIEPEPLLDATCGCMSIRGVSKERIEGEFEKLFLWAKRPSRGIRWLLKVGRLAEVLPELAVLVEVRQNPLWHPEGNVFEHTMQTVDAAAEVEELESEDKIVLMYAALCHDLGKASTTVEQVDGRLTSHGHEAAGVALARNLLGRLVGSKKRIKRVCLLVRYHMSPSSFIAMGAKAPAFKRLAMRLAPDTSLALLAKLAEADMRGRNGGNGGNGGNGEARDPLPGPILLIQEFVEKARRIGVLEMPEPPIITGNDLQGLVESGPLMGEILRRTYEIQLQEGIVDKELLKKRMLREFGLDDKL